MQEIYEKYLNLEPGKYWKLPSNKKHFIDSYLENENYVSMIKYDGYWARAIIMENKVVIQSRGISKVTKTYGEYQDKVPHIVDELLLNYPAGTVLLGELCYRDLKKGAKEVGSILRSLAPRAVKLQENDENKLSFMIFDCLIYAGEELIEKPFIERFHAKYVSGSHSIYVKPIFLRTHKESRKLLYDTWAKGGEGIILLNKNLPYNIGGAKAWHSIKVKRELGELEGKVIGTISPTVQYEGDDLDNWKYWETTDGIKFRRDSLLNMELLQGDYYPVTKPHYFGRKVGVIVQYENKIINITSGTTEEDGDYLSSHEAEKIIEQGNLYAVFTGMEFTEDSVRHPRLLRLRDDI